MIIKIEDLEKSNENTIYLDYEKENKEFNSKNLISTCLVVKKVANAIHITGRLSGWIISECDICLKEFKQNFDIEVDEKISLVPLYDYSNKEIRLNDDQLNEELLDSDSIDIDNFVYQTVILSLPNKNVCGINCSIESREENNDSIKDSRLEIFNKLKKDK